MEPEELTGYYTYRSFLNQQNPVDDFNQIKFAEAEVFLLFSRDQTIGGTLSFPAAPRRADEGLHGPLGPSARIGVLSVSISPVGVEPIPQSSITSTTMKARLLLTCRKARISVLRFVEQSSAVRTTAPAMASRREARRQASSQ